MVPTAEIQPAVCRPDLLSDPTRQTISTWEEYEDIGVIPVSEELVSGIEFCTNYGIPPEKGGKCIIIRAKRGEKSYIGACVVPINKRVDLNGIVKKHFHARQVSFLPREETLQLTQMEFGSITAIGLPPHCTVLIDQKLIDTDIFVGSGLRASKLYLPCEVLMKNTNAIPLVNLGI
jgi:prolyl-tRNA editing enzyme YbaK/EbsC (Cys-tRNA(Pro) deacylase)